MELPQDIQDKLDELGGGADIRLLAVEDDGFNRMPVWGCGWRQPVPKELRAAAYALSRDLDVDDATRHVAGLVIDGFKVAFVVKGRLTFEHTEEMKRRDHDYRENRREWLQSISDQVDRKKRSKASDEQIEAFCRDLITSEATYNYWVLDRKSVVMPGSKTTGHLAGIKSPNLR